MKQKAKVVKLFQRNSYYLAKIRFNADSYKIVAIKAPYFRALQTLDKVADITKLPIMATEIINEKATGEFMESEQNRGVIKEKEPISVRKALENFTSK